MIAESVKIESAMPSNSQDTSTYDLQAEPVTVGRASSSTSLVMSSARRQHEREQALETNMGIKQFVQKSHGPSFIDPASIARQRQEEEEMMEKVKENGKVTQYRTKKGVEGAMQSKTGSILTFC